MNLDANFQEAEHILNVDFGDAILLTDQTYKPESRMAQSGIAVAEAVEEKANKTDVYAKTETDAKFATKANVADVYTKSQTDSKLSAKANSADVYSKTNVYNKSESDVALASKLDSDSDRIIEDSNGSVGNSYNVETKLYREDGKIKIYNGTPFNAITEGALASTYISPSLPCGYDNKSKLIYAIKNHWSEAVDNRLKLFALGDQSATWKEYIYVYLNGGEYRVVNGGEWSTTSWTLDQWISGNIDICTYAASYTSDTLYIHDISSFGASVVCDVNKTYLTLITEADLALKADKAQGTWITPTMINGAVKHATYPVQYSIDSLNTVRFRGKFTTGTASVSQISIATGYRPPITLYFYLPMTSDATKGGRCDITPSGEMIFYVASTGFDLSGISYKAAQ